MAETFQAWVAREDGDDIAFRPETLETSALPEGDVTIAVQYSGVNYKDALAVTPRGGVAKTYPLVPGIDLAGVVAESTTADFSPGDRVLVHGYELGTGRHGGYAERARVPAEWVVRLGELTTFDAAAIGTAGFTAAMSVRAIMDSGVQPSDGPVLVTGASGGVGSVSVDLLAAAGYDVVASSGKTDAAGMLSDLGAREVIGRLPEDPDAKPRPLGKSQWAAAVDCVGGKTLAHVLSTIRYGGVVAASGLTGGTALNTTVMPFILRGVSLRGIDSVQLPIAPRRRLWAELEGDLRPRHLSGLARQVPARDLPGELATIKAGHAIGRTVVEVAGGF